MIPLGSLPNPLSVQTACWAVGGGSGEGAANTLRTDAIKLPGALRWVGRRVRGVQLFLSLIISLYPVKFGGLEPTPLQQRALELVRAFPGDDKSNS